MNNKFVWMSTKTRIMISEHEKKTGNEMFKGQTVRIDESLQYGSTSPDAPPFFATPAQLKAWDELDENGYSAWCTPIQSGKTFLLKNMIEIMPDKRIGIMCLSYPMFDKNYRQYNNCHYIENNDALRGHKWDLIIGDDVIIEKNPKYKIICAFTRYDWVTTVKIEWCEQTE